MEATGSFLEEALSAFHAGANAFRVSTVWSFWTVLVQTR